MERLTKFERVEFVEYMPSPTELEYGVLYVSLMFGLVICLCPDGCGEQVVCPIKPKDPEGWTYSEENGKVTLSPSVLETSCPNKAHFFIRENKIIWV